MLGRFAVVLSSIISLLAVGGCGVAMSSTSVTNGMSVSSGGAASGHAAWWRQAPSFVAKHVYVTQMDGSGAGKLFEYSNQNRDDHAPICTRSIPDFVNGIGADASGNLYLPDVAHNRIMIFRPHCGALIGTVNDRFGSPQGVVVRGTILYVWDGAGVSVCSLNGCKTHLTDPSITQMVSAAADGLGFVWGTGYGAKGISLVAWPQAQMPGHVASGYIQSGAPGNILFDDVNNLLTIDFPFAQAYRFTCDRTYFACTQLQQIGLRGSSNFGSLNGINSDIQVTDYRNTSVDVYAYPNFTYEYSYDAGLSSNAAADGIAQVP